jgi:hypothetical protein
MPPAVDPQEGAWTARNPTGLFDTFPHPPPLIFTLM